MKDPNAAKSVFVDLFSYAIGDRVCLAQFVESIELETSINGPHVNARANMNTLEVFIVEERFLVECHGGIQAFYNIRGGVQDAGQIKVTEMSLVPAQRGYDAMRKLVVPPSPWRPAVKGDVGARIANLEKQLDELNEEPNKP